MNILVFSWRDPKHPLAGGAEQVMHEHMKGWIKNGHKVTLFSSNFSNAKSNEKIDEISIIRAGNQILSVQLHAFYWYVFKKHKKFDLIIDQFHGLPFFTPLYAKIKVIAVIQEIAGKVWFKNPFPFPFNKIIGFIGFLLEPLFFIPYKSKIFITGSNSAKKELTKVGIKYNNIFVIPHGVIVNLPKKISKEKIPTVIFLGALAEDKGIKDALECFRILEEKGNKYQYWIVGKGNINYVNNLKEKYKNIKRITFFGYVDNKKKFELLSKSHIMVNPSLKEGWGLVNIEANSVKTPVVAYNSPGLIDSVKNNDTGVICRKNNPVGLALEVDKLIKNKNKYEKLQINAQKWSKKFSWKNSQKLSLQLIEKV